MKIYIDADGCPAVDITLRVARELGIPVIILCDTAHVIQREGAETITVSQGADSVDLVLANQISPGDLAVTQDYGLAALCLSRGAMAIRQDGLWYTQENIDGLLFSQYAAQKARRAGKHPKGSPKRTRAEDQNYEKSLREGMGKILG